MAPRRLHTNISCSLALLSLLATVSFSVCSTWYNCTTQSCQTLFANSHCNTSCTCGSTTNQTTCNIQPITITNKTNTVLNATEGNLDCCLCTATSKFCCKPCPAVNHLATPNMVLATTPNKVVTTTSPPIQDTAYVIVAFFTDCAKYTIPIKDQISTSFNYVIGNITMAIVNVTDITCSSGVQPYCGVDLTSLINSGANSNSIKCSSLVITAILKSTNPTLLRSSVAKLQKRTQLGNLTLQLSDGSKIKADIMISRYSNSTNALHHGKLVLSTTGIPPRTTVPPILMNIWPLIYSGIGVGSFLFLCIVYQCLKQSYYLRKKKFTTINSNRINSRKKKMEEAMENKSKDDQFPNQVGFDMTLHRMPVVDNEALTRRYDWTTPSYLPSILAPAYSNNNNGRQSPPRLMLDEEDSDAEKRSIGKASVINVDEESDDDDLREILESEDDEDMRPNTRQSYVSRNKSRNNNGKFSSASRTYVSKSRNDSAQIRPPTMESRVSFGEKNGRKSPRLSYGNVKNNRITPIDNNLRKTSVSSLKPRKIVDSSC